MPPRFLDTNVLLALFTRDDEAKAERALALLQRVERGEEKVETSLLVLFETVYTLQRFYQVPRPASARCSCRSFACGGSISAKQLCVAALDVYVNRNISFADAYHSVYLQAHGRSEIYSWDTDFDKLPGLTRLEPRGRARAPGPHNAAAGTHGAPGVRAPWPPRASNPSLEAWVHRPRELQRGSFATATTRVCRGSWRGLG